MKDLVYSSKNFKCFPHSNLEIRPLTIILGPNSSGKSSLIQPLILLKQTLSSLDNDSPLILNGSLINLGSYEDIIFNHEVKRSLVFRFQWKRPKPQYPVPPGFEDVYSKLSFPALINLLISIKYSKQTHSMYLSRFRACINEMLIVNIGLTPKGKTSSFHSDFLPKHIPYQPNYKNCLADLHSLHFGKSAAALPQSDFEELLHFINLSSFLQISQTISNYLEKITYLGPLRSKPQSLYISGDETRLELGSSGEFAIQRMIQDFDREPSSNSIAALKHWLIEFGLAKDVRLKKISEWPSKGIFRLEITDPSTRIDANLANVGFGVSQLLPIIVASHVADPGTLIIVEEPEIHLNPKVQAELADMFISFLGKKSFIIETHSEHILLRVQRRIAEGRIDPADVKLYFVGTTKGKHSRRYVKDLHIDKSGMISKWPEDFFESDFEDDMAIMQESLKNDKSSD